MKSEEIVIKQVHENPLGCGCLVKAVLTFGIYIIWWAAKRLTVTNKRVVWRSGVFSSNERSIPLNRVADINVRSGMFGKMIGYGDMRIESAGGPGTEILAPGISDPNGIRDAIIAQSK